MAPDEERWDGAFRYRISDEQEVLVAVRRGLRPRVGGQIKLIAPWNTVETPL
jgi:hypothetical protein